MADDSFHEIQLSGKQLVFLFMAITVVLVVIFLCGVLVGRGVRSQQTMEFAARTVPGAVPSVDPALAAGQPPPAPQPILDAPETDDAGDVRRDLSYPESLEREEPLLEELQVPVDPAPSADEGEPSSARAPAAPAGDGFAVQVAALRERGVAETMVQQLAEKGYPAYLVDPLPSAPAPVYRVRVGKYDSRREAEQIVRRLEEEEQFKPWITR